tara:strand:- start:188 stop:334 length:147 start_codon:yes stop_codon:yes gene_type:complete
MDQQDMQVIHLHLVLLKEIKVDGESDLVEEQLEVEVVPVVAVRMQPLL